MSPEVVSVYAYLRVSDGEVSYIVSELMGTYRGNHPLHGRLQEAMQQPSYLYMHDQPQNP